MSKSNGKDNIFDVTTGEPLEKGGYFVAYNLVVRNAMKVFNLTTGEYCCLIMLFSYAGREIDKAFPSQELLAEDLNTTTRTVRRYLDGLLSKGVIEIYNRQNSKNLKINNLYDLSPCLNKIRELFCKEFGDNYNPNVKVKKKKPNNDGQDNIVLSEKSTFDDDENLNEKITPEKAHNEGQDKIVLSEIMDRTDLSAQTGQNCPTTNNTKQIDDKDINKPYIEHIDDDKRTVRPSKYDEESIDLIISQLREATKDELPERSFKAVVKKVVDKYNQGLVNSFRDYLVSSLVNKIEELEERRLKESAKNELKDFAKKKAKDRYKELMNYKPKTEVTLYKWWEQD